MHDGGRPGACGTKKLVSHFPAQKKTPELPCAPTNTPTNNPVTMSLSDDEPETTDAATTTTTAVEGTTTTADTDGEGAAANEGGEGGEGDQETDGITMRLRIVLRPGGGDTLFFLNGSTRAEIHTAHAVYALAQTEDGIIFTNTNSTDSRATDMVRFDSQMFLHAKENQWLTGLCIMYHSGGEFYFHDEYSIRRWVVTEEVYMDMTKGRADVCMT